MLALAVAKPTESPVVVARRRSPKAVKSTGVAKGQGGSLRVVAGRFKGQKIGVPPGDSVRPTSDRVRENLFNILAHLPNDNGVGSVLNGARVLDRFAGSGALGIEALSRGAASCTFVDRSAATRQLINENLRGLKGLGQGCFAVGSEGLLASAGPFNLMFFDPPYGFDQDGWNSLFADLTDLSLAKRGALAIIERDQVDQGPSELRGWQELKARQFGRTHIGIWRLN